MKLKSIKIKGFRNLKPLTLDFTGGNDIFAFVGANGQGKTNILEAIYLCSLSKSFRTRTHADLVGFEQDFSSVKCQTDDKEMEVIVTSKPFQKVLKINGVKKTASDFVGNLKAVFFSPDDLAYMAFSPKLRRRYIDVVLTQLDHVYLEELMRYNEACQQRNALLKRIREGKSGESELDFWEEQLAKFGSAITRRRVALIEKLQISLNRHYQEIAHSDAALEIIYQTEVKGSTAPELQGLYKNSRSRDIVSGQTHLGPHRDDLEFHLNGHDMAQFSSRGEWRSLVLALKFSEIDLIKEETGENPVLLLDDVFSELDAERQKYLFEASGRSQTLITTTHQEFIEALPKKPRLFTVKAGHVE